jgi:hypothetical protein
MTAGNTTTGSLADSLPTVIASARNVREFVGVMPGLCDKVTLGEGVGLTWNEISLSKLSATNITEATELNNPQQLADTLFSITPSMVAVQTVITDRVARRISKNVFAKVGSLAQQAIQRNKDEAGLVVLDGATTSLCGAGTTLTSGYIAAAVYRITSNTTEPGNKPIYCVLHGYQIKDLFDELVAGVGTYVVNAGATADVFKSGFNLPIAGCSVFEDGNITPDSSDDAKGGVFAKEGIVLVQGASPRVVMVRNEKLGGGATEVLHYDEFAYGERSPGNWVMEIYSDAATPTS